MEVTDIVTFVFKVGIEDYGPGMETDWDGEEKELFRFVERRMHWCGSK